MNTKDSDALREKIASTEAQLAQLKDRLHENEAALQQRETEHGAVALKFEMNEARRGELDESEKSLNEAQRAEQISRRAVAEIARRLSDLRDKQSEVDYDERVLRLGELEKTGLAKMEQFYKDASRLLELSGEIANVRREMKHLLSAVDGYRSTHGMRGNFLVTAPPKIPGLPEPAFDDYSDSPNGARAIFKTKLSQRFDEYMSSFRGRK